MSANTALSIPIANSLACRVFLDLVGILRLSTTRSAQLVPPHRYLTVNRWMFGFVFSLVLCLSLEAVFADESLLVRVKRPDGSESALLSKVVVTSDNAVLVKQPGEKNGEPIPAFSIFFRLKTDAGTLEEKGRDGISYWRVGDSNGNPKVWIKQFERITVDGKVTDTTLIREWNSRFILDPIDGQDQWPAAERFQVALKGGAVATLQALAAGQKRFAFVTGSPGGEGLDERFPVIVYAGETGSKAVRSSGSEILEDLRLEIAFVLESTDFMQSKFNDGKTLKDYVLDIIREMLTQIEQSGKLKDRVKLAIVEYQDTQDTDKIKFVTRVTQGLTNSTSEIEKAFGRFEGSVIGGDWPEDGIAGIHTAINELEWSPNSCKHIVLIGLGALQEKPKGRQESQYGGEYNSVTEVKDFYGWSSTGLDVRGITVAAHPNGQDVIDRVLKRKNLHALRIDRRSEPLEKEIEEFRDDLVQSSESELEAKLEVLADRGVNLRELIPVVFSNYLANYQIKLASQQYRKLSENDGNAQGFFDETEATPEGVRDSTRKLILELERALEEYDKLAKNEFTTSNREEAGAFTESLYAIADAALREKLKRDPALVGEAETRNASGREVAQLRVMVGRKELEVLRNKMDAIQQTFASRTKKADRQNVDDILKDLQSAIASGAAGQGLDAGVNLQDVITDLPLKTQCLRTTAADIAAMSPEDFADWLSQVSYAVKRCNAILDNSEEWVSIGSGVIDEYAFLRRDELP